MDVKEIADEYNLKVLGDGVQKIKGINEIHKVKYGDLMFVDSEKYYQKALASAATFILINKEIDCPLGKTLLVCADPFDIYNKLVKRFRPELQENIQSSPTALIHPGAIVHPTAYISHYAVIGEGAMIDAHVTIGEYSVIGRNSRIQAGSIIGSDAFYYKKVNGQFIKWRSCGRTIIQDHVEIGAGCTINKGVSGDTVIGQGTKIDCQVHIGHGVIVGKNCLFAAQVGIGGKTIIGDNVVLYGQVGVTQNLHIGNNVTVLAGAGVSKNLEDGKTYFGAPAEEAKKKFREIIALKQLPETLKSLNKQY